MTEIVFRMFKNVFFSAQGRRPLNGDRSIDSDCNGIYGVNKGRKEKKTA